MRFQSKTNQQLQQELAQVKNELSYLCKASEEYIKVNESLNLERGLYLDLANAIPSGIYRLRVFSDGGTNEEKWSSLDNAPYSIEFVNDRFCEILNLDKHAYRIHPGIINHFIYEADKVEFVKKNVEANLYSIPFLWEGRFVVNEEMIWVHFESVPRVLENRDIIWTGTLNDISERKKAEEELTSINNELQKLNAEKDKFFSILAHDLRSPFNSIIGFSNILLEKVQMEDFENSKEYAGIIINSSQRAMNLLTNLMQWSQSQTGRLNFNPEDFKIETIIDEIILLFADTAIQKSISITKVLPSSLAVYGDKAMIDTIIRNLVSNALKFTPQGGTIIISVEADHKGVKVSVADSGVGMLKSIMEKLFRIDVNCSTYDTQGEKGTGLGLILCKDFIKQHGGKIGVESEPGKGSKFHFTIPNNSNTDIQTDQ
jgi:signal transduction histidine kinase